MTGHHCSIAEHGYSRTHRPDLEQVELGLLVTPDGLPITHEVFPGSTPDKTTVKQILERLKEDFAVEQCVFVGDRGMVTHKNFELLAGLSYPYIVGYHKRGRLVSDRLLEDYRDLGQYTRIRDNLMYIEVPASAVDDDESEAGARYILCHNPVKAVHDEAFRKSAVEEAEEALSALAVRLTQKHRGRKPSHQSVMVKVGETLTKKSVQAFLEVVFDGNALTYTRNEAALAKEALRDGKFVVKTNTQLPAAEVVTSYKTLISVERAFQEIKNFLDVGPMYHWNERRVRGHIFVCVLAYLFEQELQVMYRKAWESEAEKVRQNPNDEEREKQMSALDARWYTGEAIVKELRSWNAFKGKFLGKDFVSVPPPSRETVDALKAVGIPLPPKLLQLDSTKQKAVQTELF